METKIEIEKIKLNNEIDIPLIGLGTFRVIMNYKYYYS